MTGGFGFGQDGGPDLPQSGSEVVAEANRPDLDRSGAAGAAAHQAGDRWVDPQSGIAFRYIPPGSWRMGSPAGEPGRSIKEIEHEVATTRGFWIGETEVTQKQWQQLMGKNPSQFESCGEDCPVENVNWYLALKFCNALSVQAGLDQCYILGGTTPDFVGLQCGGFRLPTEAEWERAARAGTQTALFTGDLTIQTTGFSPELDTIAWFAGNSGVRYKDGDSCSWWKENLSRSDRCGTHPVGQVKPNQWRVHDMLGNVWEWTWDAMAPYPSTAVTDPAVMVDDVVVRVVRGGAWDSSASDCRVASRDARRAKSRSSSVGLRVVRTADAAPPQTTENGARGR